MTQQILELRGDCLSNPSRADLIGFEATMLYPNPEQQLDERSEATLSATIEDGLAFLQTMSQEEHSAFTRRAAKAMPIGKIRQQIEVRKGGPFVKGCIAGDVLTLALQPHAAMKRVMFDVVKAWRQVWRVDAKSIENGVWPYYRRVAHFWAAHLELRRQRGAPYPFPCAVSDLSTFLGMAEAFRRSGETTQLRMSRRTVLITGELIRLPDDILIPHFKIELASSDAV